MGEAQEFHRLRCFRLKCLLKMNIEGVMIAAGESKKTFQAQTPDVFLVQNRVIEIGFAHNIDFFNRMNCFHSSFDGLGMRALTASMRVMI